MIMADVLTWFLLIAGTILVLNAYWLAATSLAPRLVDECQSKYGRPWLITGLGILSIVPFALIAKVFGGANHPVLKLLAFLSLAPAIISGMAGSAGLARKIGHGLISSADEKQPWRQVLRGGLVLAFTLLLPFIGWFVLFPWTLISGLGAVTLTLWRWRQSRAKAQHRAMVQPEPTSAPQLINPSFSAVAPSSPSAHPDR